MLSFIYTAVSWFISFLEWALPFAGWDAFVTLKSETVALTDGRDYPRNFWSCGRAELHDCGGSVDAWGPGLHVILSPCERRHFGRFVWQSILGLPAAILMAPLTLAGWSTRRHGARLLRVRPCGSRAVQPRVPRIRASCIREQRTQVLCLRRGGAWGGLIPLRLHPQSIRRCSRRGPREGASSLVGRLTLQAGARCVGQ
jgi:hypothetical protein